MTDILGGQPEPGTSPTASPTAAPPTFADRLVQQQKVAQGGQAARESQRPYRSGGTRARALVGLLWASLAGSVIAAAINIWGWLTLDAYDAGRASVEDLETFDAVFGGFAFVEIAIFVAAALAWLAWQSRTIDNEGPLGIGPSPWSPAMSIVWWFVPLANLIQPYRIHRDMWTRFVGMSGARLVLWWWLAYLGSSIVSNAAGRLWLLADTVESLQAGLVVWLVADIVAAVSVLPAVALVARIQRRADALAATPPQPSDTLGSPSVGAP